MNFDVKQEENMIELLETLKEKSIDTVFELITSKFDLTNEQIIWMLSRNIYHVAYANPRYILEFVKLAIKIDSFLTDEARQHWEDALTIPIVIVNYDDPSDPQNSSIYPVVSSHESLYLFGILAHFKIVKFTDHLNSIFKLFDGKSSFQKTPIFNAIIPLLCSCAKTIDKNCPALMKQLKRYLKKKKPSILNELENILAIVGDEDVLITPCIRRPFDTRSQPAISTEAMLQIALSNDDDQYLMEYFLDPSSNFSMILQPSVCTPSEFLVRDVPILHFAAFYGAIKCFKYLLANGADVKMLESSDEHYGLDFYATASGNLEIFRISERQTGGNIEQALYSTVCFWELDICQWIIENRSPVFTRDLLIAAASTNNIKMVKFLVNKGVNFWGEENTIAGDGEFEISDEIKKVDAGEDFDEEDEDSTPLEIACQWDCMSIVHIFCQSLNSMPKELFRRSFITAIEASSIDVLKYLAANYPQFCKKEIIDSAMKSVKDNDLVKSQAFLVETFPSLI